LGRAIPEVAVPLSPEDVRALVAAFDGSDWDEMTLTVDGTRLALSRSGRPPTAEGGCAARPPGPAAAAVAAASLRHEGGAAAAPVSSAEPQLAGPAAPEAAPGTTPATAVGVPHAAGTGAGGATVPSVATPGEAASAPGAAPAAPAGHRVTAPSVGLFWRSPKPGAPPFVEVGDEVRPDDTVCIVEVMKLMNHVRAGVAGTVRAVHPQNGEMVEHGDPLFTIEPAR
jgi:acetyl-CoA carboxylase biotin carboxyl carrier protein